MTEHKYESDMTRQEKRQQEREKIASMNWGQRIDSVSYTHLTLPTN